MDSEINQPNDLDKERNKRLMAYREALSRYIRSKPSDTGKISEMLLEIKGSNNLRDTAAKLATNASTLSRAINETTGHISDDLIVAMAEEADRREDLNFTFKDIVEANGMVPRAEARRTQIAAYEKNTINLIVAEMVTHGITVQKLDDNATCGSSWPRHFDSVIECNRNGKNLKIGVEVSKLSYYEDGKTHPVGSPIMIRQKLERIFAFAYCNTSCLDKILFAVDSERGFSQIKSMFKEAQIPDDISILLVSTDGSSIIDEYAIPKRDHSEYLMFR